MRALLLILSSFILFSFNDNKPNFVGEYQTHWPTLITFQPTPLSRREERHDAKGYYQACPISISIYEDQDGKLSGSGELTFYSAKKDFLRHSVEKIRTSFDIKNIRFSGDTLIFNLESAAFQATGISPKVLIIKANGKNLIGLGKDIVGKKDELENKNPYYFSKDDEFTYFISSSNKDLVNQFYLNQINYLNELISKETEKVKMIYWENSLELLKEKVL